MIKRFKDKAMEIFEKNRAKMREIDFKKKEKIFKRALIQIS